MILQHEGRAPDGSLPVGPSALLALLSNLNNAAGPESRLASVEPAAPEVATPGPGSSTGVVTQQPAAGRLLLLLAAPPSKRRAS